MKKRILSVRSVRLALACMLVALLPALNSCKKESADVTDLLSSVPSSASAVVGFNLGTMLEKAGCKVEGSSITPGPEVEQWINSQKEYVANEKEALKLFLSGESGVDPVGAIYFADAYDSYITAALADTGKFMEFVEKQSGQTFADAGNDVKVCGNVAVCGAQTWVSMSSKTAIDAKAIKNYSALDNAQSFMANPISAKLANMTHDVTAWGQIKQLAKKGLSFGDAASVNLISSMLFENANCVLVDLDLLKGKLSLQASLLNEKGQPAKYLLPADKVNVSDITALAPNAELIAAMSITKEFTKKVENVSSSLGGDMFGQVMKALKSLDGTVAVALGNIDNPGESIKGVVTTDGNPSMDLLQILSQFGPTQKDGKLVKFGKGTVAGGLDVAKVSDYLKGSTFGFVLNANTSNLNGASLGLSLVAFSINPADGGVTLNLNAESQTPDENILLTLLKKSMEK